MLDWTEILIGTAALGGLCVAWVLWQQLAARLDPAQRGRKPAGRCSLPAEFSSPPSKAPCEDRE